MPVYNKVPFRRKKPDPNIKDTDMVWFMAETREVFTNYDDYFNRYIKINTLCWTCAVTGKTGLTFQDALKSENDAIKDIVKTFPKPLLRPLLWFAHHMVYRGRLDDLVNDVYMISRDRYFVGEVVWFLRTEHTRVKGVITAVKHVPSRAPWRQRSAEEATSDNDVSTASTSKKKTIQKPLDPDAPPAESYLYSFRQEGDSDEDDDENVVHDLTHHRIGRPKSVGSRQKIKLCLKEMTRLEGDKVIVLKHILEENGIEDLRFEEFFAGPKPIFQQIPRVRQPMHLATDRRKLEFLPDESPKKKRRLTKSEKLKKQIEEQQEDLKDLFETAKSLEVENLSDWQQTERVLTSKEISDLKDAIKSSRESFKEKEKERKKREKEEQLLAKKPRDDLLCDDLKPLPPLVPLNLPDYLDNETFAEILSLSQFFATSDQFTDKRITFRDCLVAVCSPPTGANSPLVAILDALLLARAQCIEQEDGDEANFANPLEMTNETTSVANNKVHGERVGQINRLHEHFRSILGCAPGSLSRDWRCLSETLRIAMITSGYCPMGQVYTNRTLLRGNMQCYEDPMYELLGQDDSLAKKLETASIFELIQSERLLLLTTLRDQVNSFIAFRDSHEAKLAQLPELRREFKQLRQWDTDQERASRVGPAENEATPSNKKTDNKTVQKLRTYLKAINEGLRVRDFDEVKEILMTSVPYELLTSIEAKDIREQQKNFFNEKMEELNKRQFELFCKLGTGLLGRDRAFRHYFYFEQFPVILVERMDDPGECGDPTPIRDADDLSEADLTAERVHLMACTGDEESCPIHGESQHSKWSVLAATGGIDSLIDALNLRGFRETELAETLTIFRPFLAPVVDDVAALLPAAIPLENGLAMTEAPEVHAPSLLEHLQLEPFTVAMNSPKEPIMAGVIEQLLKLENRITNARVNKLRFPEGQSREDFRDAVAAKQDLRQFLDASDLRHHCYDEAEWITQAEVDALAEDESYLGQLKLALVKIIHSVKLKYIFDPFTLWEYHTKGKGLLVPTKIFVDWQKELLKCASPSAVALFASSFERSIVFSKHILKCTSCKKPALLHESATCDACGSRYHNACAPATLSSRASWLCKSCVAKGAVGAGKCQAAMQTPNNEGAYVGLDESDEEQQSEHSADEADNNSSIENHHVPAPVKPPPKPGQPKSQRKRQANCPVEAEELYEFKSSNPDAASRRKSSRRPAPKHKSDSEDEANHLRAVAMGLRTGGAHEEDVRKQLNKCLKIIEKHIGTTLAYPFATPVSRKYAEYHEVIHNPMDLRTMINKFKNLDYNSPADVWQDIQLIFTNCRIFNDDGSEIRASADELEKLLREDFRAILGSEVDA